MEPKSNNVKEQIDFDLKNLATKLNSKDEQESIEKMIQNIFDKFNFSTKNAESYNFDVELRSNEILSFSSKMINKIPKGYTTLDSGMPWFAYWVLNIFNMYSNNKIELSSNIKSQFLEYLKTLQHPEGGFVGYPYGKPHLISNYAAILAIMSLNNEEAYQIIDREKMRKYLKSMKNNNFNNKELNRGNNNLKFRGYT